MEKTIMIVEKVTAVIDKSEVAITPKIDLARAISVSKKDGKDS